MHLSVVCYFYKNHPSMSDLPQSIQSTLQAIAHNRLTPALLLEASAHTANSAACQHVYMPGTWPEAREGAGTAPEAHANVSNLPALKRPLAGITVSIKDLFDVAGQQTLAGSPSRAGVAPALSDAPAVARLRAAGAVLAGRTNMVEFAFSGVGINPHYGTPVNPCDAAVDRIPGGSSSGAAVSVATGAALAALGSDTGGSLRIPAALCGIVGFKSTARLVPLQGAVPLSSSLDTIGALTRSVADAVLLHGVLADSVPHISGKPLAQLRFALVTTQMQDAMDDVVATQFAKSIALLRTAGAHIVEIALPEVNQLAAINATGGLSAAESFAWHRSRLSAHGSAYDPRVLLRIRKGESMSAADYIDLLAARANWICQMNTRLAGFDAVLSPTVPIVAPAIASVLHDDAEFFRVNGLLLRNTSVVNMLDGCAISLPCQAPGVLPVGLMLWQGALQDEAVLNAALAVEQTLAVAYQ